jgi:hypothetical protein
LFLPVSFADEWPEKVRHSGKLSPRSFPGSPTAPTIGLSVEEGPRREDRERKRPATAGTHRRPGEVQQRLATKLSFEEYVTSRAWKQASLNACPFCAPGSCRFHRLGTYLRKVPAVAFVTRYYCPESHTTIGLLPDFYASRMPGTLDDIEETVTAAEVASVEVAANAQRPAEAPDAVTLGAAIAWVRRRMAMVRTLLVTVAGLFPEALAGVGGSIRGLRERLGTSRALVALREICERHLYALRRPLGLNPRVPPTHPRDRAHQQSTRPAPASSDR